MRRRHPLARAAAAVVGVVALVACSIQPGAGGGSGLPADTMLIGADTGSPTFERVFNPYLVSKRTASTYIYEPLLLVNPLNADDITPWLATEYSTPDASTFVVTLREGVTWSDGEPFTAEDVVFTFEMLKEHPALDVYGAWQHIETISVDGSTVTFALQDQDLPAVQQIGQTVIVPEHVWSEVDDPETFTNEDPVGSGPYVLGRFNPQQYTLDKNPDYWQADKVAAEHLVLPASNTQLDLVSKGYDWAYSYISGVQDTWGRGPGNSWWFPAGGVIGLIPNTTEAPFDDVRVRRALSLAFDRTSIADAAAEGYMDPASQTGLLLPNQQDLLDDSIPDGGRVERDLDGARDLLEQAGFTMRGKRLLDPDGEPVTVDVTTANGFSDWLRAAQEVRVQLADLGIQVTISSPQPGGYYEAQAAGDFELLLGSFGSGNVYQGYNTLLSGDLVVPVGESATGNYGRYEDAEATRFLAQYRSTTDPAAQQQALDGLQRTMMEDVPAIGLYYGGLWGLYNDSRFTGWPSEEDPYVSPQTYDAPPLRILTSIERAG